MPRRCSTRSGSLNDIVETYGPNNTLLDNCHVYTAFAAQDPLSQERISRLTGLVTETRASRSGPSGIGAGRASVTVSETERPLLEPGEVRALPARDQLVFVAGFRPFRTQKLRYDKREPFRSRAKLPPPEAYLQTDRPPAPPHPWRGRRAAGSDPGVQLPLFKEAEAARRDRVAEARMGDVYRRIGEDLAAQEAVLDHLQGRIHDEGDDTDR